MMLALAGLPCVVADDRLELVMVSEIVVAPPRVSCMEGELERERIDEPGESPRAWLIIVCVLGT